MGEKPALPILNDSPSPRRAMTRREMVQRVLSAAGAGFVFPGVPAGHPMHKHLANATTLEAADARIAAKEWTPEFLDPHQIETLVALAERLVPGSSKAQVNRFIDLLLTVDTEENQRKFLASLSAFESEALGRSQRPFKDLTEDDQNQILTAASAEKSGRAEGSKDESWFSVPSAGSSPPRRVTLRDHFENLKGWVSGAYYSSEIGMRELGWTGNNFFESFPGCQHPDGHR